MSGDIRVNPPSVVGFGRQAQELFGLIRSELEGLVGDAIKVKYYGPSAEAFKTECGSMASTFAEELTKELRSMAAVVQSSTSNISRSLGGQVVAIDFEGGVIPVPAVPPGDGSVGVNAVALDGLKTDCQGRFRSISAQLDKNLSNLVATDWTGNAKTQAASSVTSYTERAKTKVLDASSQMATRIETQIQAAQTADKT